MKSDASNCFFIIKLARICVGVWANLWVIILTYAIVSQEGKKLQN